MIKKITLLLVFLLLMGGGAKFYFDKKKQRQNAIPVSIYQPHFAQNYTFFTEGKGKIRPLKEYFLTVKAGGRLDEVLVKQGEVVSKDQFIAIIDKNVRKTSLESALSAFKGALSELNRSKELKRQGAATARDIELAKENVDIKRLKLEEAKTVLKDGIIKAPVAGQLSMMAFNLGDYIPNGSRVGIIEDISMARLQIKIPSKYRDLVAGKSLIWVQSQNVEYALTGNVLLPKSTQLTQSGFTDVTFQFKQLPAGLAFHDWVWVKIPVNTYVETTIVDNYILRWQKGEPQVLTLKKNKDAFQLHYQPVQLGLDQKGKVAILNLNKTMQIIDPRMLDIEKIIAEKRAISIKPVERKL